MKPPPRSRPGLNAGPAGQLASEGGGWDSARTDARPPRRPRQRGGDSGRRWPQHVPGCVVSPRCRGRSRCPPCREWPKKAVGSERIASPGRRGRRSRLGRVLRPPPHAGAGRRRAAVVRRHHDRSAATISLPRRQKAPDAPSGRAATPGHDTRPRSPAHHPLGQRQRRAPTPPTSQARQPLGCAWAKGVAQRPARKVVSATVRTPRRGLRLPLRPPGVTASGVSPGKPHSAVNSVVQARGGPPPASKRGRPSRRVPEPRPGVAASTRVWLTPSAMKAAPAAPSCRTHEATAALLRLCSMGFAEPGPPAARAAAGAGPPGHINPCAPGRGAPPRDGEGGARAPGADRLDQGQHLVAPHLRVHRRREAGEEQARHARHGPGFAGLHHRGSRWVEGGRRGGEPGRTPRPTPRLRGRRADFGHAAIARPPPARHGVGRHGEMSCVRPVALAAPHLHMAAR